MAEEARRIERRGSAHRVLGTPNKEAPDEGRWLKGTHPRKTTMLATGWFLGVLLKILLALGVAAAVTASVLVWIAVAK